MSSDNKGILAPRIEDRQRAKAALALLASGPASLVSLYDALDIRSDRDRKAFRVTLANTTRAKVSIYGNGRNAMACIGEPPAKQITLRLSGNAKLDNDHARVVELLAEKCAALIREAQSDGFPVNATELKAFCKNESEWSGVKRVLKSQGFDVCGKRSSVWTVIEEKDTSND